ncbi:hypothetical protein K469DRAFT_683279 [Zopfia rhizophila CBS 207.26]|uniref:Ankyrin 2,3/unc44 n=1 Tax=Zopfia rhizophila CBS 207.26 TaxID=1314779 RepID=A0A6A6EF72_9PEZI|nr:hypothetical protein K469DRAFT_683279 [Zopfia rhizophila CBS 207.26]
MTSPEPISPKLFARDIAAYSDAELDRYLEETRRTVDIEDPENLPEDFIQRLRDRAHLTTETVQSRPVDLDQVAARLLQVPTDKEAPPRSFFPPARPPVYEEEPYPEDDYHQLWETGSASTQPLDEEEEYRESLQRETEAYHALDKDGGRPSHPLNLLEDIVKNPGEYREILSFWQSCGNHDDDWEVFTRQLSRWKSFRRFQRFVREPNIEDERIIYISGQYRIWDHFVGRQQPITGEEGRFPIYVRAVKDRLTKHGFTRTFQLDEDPARQDKLTTWIEYLGYEYWWYDQYALSKRQQQRLDDAWKKLVDAKVLRPFETQEFICSIESGFLEQNEEDRAKEAVESAKSAVMLAQKTISDPRRNYRSPKESQQRLLEAQSKLDAEVKKYNSIKRRNSLIDEFTERTKNIRIAKEDAECHSILLRWMLQQLPLIELELKQSDTAGNDSDGRGRRRRLKLDRAGELGEGQSPTDQSSDDGENPTTSDRRTRIASTFQGDERRKRRSHDTVDEERPSKRSRHNGQIRCLSDRKTSESADTTAATGGSHGSKTATARTVRGERKLTRVADKGGRGVKAGNFSGPSHSLRSRKKSTLDTPQPSTATKSLRRSTRIAEREQQLCTAIAVSSDSVKRPYQRTPKPTQMPTPPLTEPQQPEAPSPVTKSAKRSRSKQSGRRDTSKPQGISKKKKKKGRPRS